MKRLCHLLTFSVFAALVTACGSSGKSADKPVVVDPPPPQPEVTYPLKGNATGLKGTVVLNAGGETLSLTSAGSFVFKNQYKLGQAYAVTISTQPSGQICGLKNATNLMVASPVAVELSCSDGYATKIGSNLVTPAAYELKDLKVTSNYESLGGTGDPQLLRSSQIKVSENSFVSLGAATNNKLFYLAYIADQNVAATSLNAESTALALMMLEPTIALSLESTQLSAKAFLELIAPTDLQGNRQLSKEFSDLAVEINAKIKRNIALFENDPGNTSFYAALEKAIALSLKTITDKSLADMHPVVSPVSQDDVSGVSATSTLSADKSTLQVTLTNKQNRTVAVGVNVAATQKIDPAKCDKAALVLAPGEFADLRCAVDATAAYNLVLDIVGPGKRGNYSVAVNNLFAKALGRSSEQDFLAAGISRTLGIANPSAKAVSDCFSATSKNALHTAVETNFGTDLIAAITAKTYYQAYAGAAQWARTTLIATDSSFNELLACGNLGLGGLTAAEKPKAKANILSLLKGWNDLQLAANIKLDLFFVEGQSQLVKGIAASNAVSQWSTSNAFDVNVVLPSTPVQEGESNIYSASCKANNFPINCTITWTFEDSHVLTGEKVNYAFSKFSADQKIIVAAKDANGFTINKVVTQNVAFKGSQIQLFDKKNGLPISESYKFGSIFANTSLPYQFVVKNSGNQDLTISSLEADNAAFSISGNTATPIAPQQSAIFTVLFKPSAPGDYKASIKITSNDKYHTNLAFDVLGTAIAEVKTGEIKVDGTLITSNALYKGTPAITGAVDYASIRSFASDSDYPQVALSLDTYVGPGRYSLNDDAVKDPDSCRGYYSEAPVATDKAFAKQYCTSGTNHDNDVTIEELPAGDKVKINYNFSATALGCEGTGCTPKTIKVLGFIVVDKAVLVKMQ